MEYQKYLTEPPKPMTPKFAENNCNICKSERKRTIEEQIEYERQNLNKILDEIFG